jgi:hypothetical protein
VVKHLVFLAIALAIACAPSMRSRLPNDARCYNAPSIIWPLGADTGTEKGSASWLILLVRPYSDSARRLAAYAVDTHANTYGGSWQPLAGDSLEASLWDVFTVTQLRLGRDRDVLTGTAHGTGDEMKQDSSGAFVPFEYDWAARFQRVTCGSVPRSLLKHVDA